MDATAADVASAEALIAAIAAKLESNQAIVAQSIAFGRLSWRRARDGTFEINLEPRI